MSDEQQGQELEGGAQPPATPPGEPSQPPQQPYQPPPPAPPQAEFANTSGTGGPVPEEIKGWSWGAFWLNWIWGIAHNVWISLLYFCLGLIWMIVLGIKGNEWAWQHRRFDSIEQFKETQAVWSKWGWIIFAIQVAIGILWTIFAVVLAGSAAMMGEGG